MSKLYHKPISFDRTKGYNQNLADAINEHWKVHVATPGQNCYVESTLYRGVPRIAYDQNYKHPDIVWAYLDEHGKWIVRK